MGVTFRIIEQDTSKKEKEEYEKFIELYNEGLTTQQILNEVGLTKYKYNKHKQEALKKGNIVPRQRYANPKYYYRTKNGHFIVSRRNPDTNIISSYGTYATEEEAQKKVRELIKNNWCV